MSKIYLNVLKTTYVEVLRSNCINGLRKGYRGSKVTLDFEIKTFLFIF